MALRLVFLRRRLPAPSSRKERNVALILNTSCANQKMSTRNAGLLCFVAAALPLVHLKLLSILFVLASNTKSDSLIGHSNPSILLDSRDIVFEKALKDLLLESQPHILHSWVFKGQLNFA